MMNRIWSAAFGKPRNVVALLLMAVAAFLHGRAAAVDLPDQRAALADKLYDYLMAVPVVR
ncbi:MAG: hypothetical protein J0M28_13155 [Thauera sp.]|nr:hypothetical protein [Thauera sp.]